jgi:hypothetical protein
MGNVNITGDTSDPCRSEDFCVMWQCHRSNSRCDTENSFKQWTFQW